MCTLSFASGPISTISPAKSLPVEFPGLGRKSTCYDHQITAHAHAHANSVKYEPSEERWSRTVQTNYLPIGWIESDSLNLDENAPWSDSRNGFVGHHIGSAFLDDDHCTLSYRQVYGGADVNIYSLSRGRLCTHLSSFSHQKLRDRRKK